MNLIIFILFSSLLNAGDKCISWEQANMPKVTPITQGRYTVDFCYLEENSHQRYYRDFVVLKKDGKIVAKSETKLSITIGRISDLRLEKSTDRYLNVSFLASELCTGLVIFDLKKEKVVSSRGCLH